MNKQQLTEDIDRMDEIADRLADREDIWQDRYVYWIAIAIRDILLEMVKGVK